MKKNNHGFTLIELMIVVGIIGILASIAVPSYRSYVIQANVTRALTLMQEAKIQVTEQHELYGTLPSHDHRFFDNPDPEAAVLHVYWWESGGFARIEAHFGPGSGSINNTRLWLLPDFTNPNTTTWTCSTHQFYDIHKIPTEALPSECR